ncbi:MAG TPA: cation:proton antiporter [Candidatus Thermoplasmatota archaeon]|nr:cation:proton antiporter [Candidatus Thermoplasmatota archaeon]
MPRRLPRKPDDRPDIRASSSSSSPSSSSFRRRARKRASKRARGPIPLRQRFVPLDQDIAPTLLLDLFLVGLGAVLGGWMCRRLGVPEVLGYLGAGMLLGSGLHNASFVDAGIVRAIGQFAVVFRMFLLGLDFDARRLRGRWRPALTAGVLEMSLCTLAGVGLAYLLGWPLLEGAVVGAALGTTSTNILSRALADRNMSQREDARAAGAATLTEDLIAMTLLALLTVFAGATNPSLVWKHGIALLVFASLAFTAGAIFAPIALDRLGRSKSEELMVLAVLGMLFGFAALSIGLGAGPAVGAFLGGIAVGAARHAPGVGDRVIPLRDMLVPVAYVGIGLVLDFGSIVRVAPLALAVALVFVVLKVVAITIGLRLGGTPTTTAARAGAILGQVGTMGIVLACSPFLAPDHFPTLIAFAFCAWAFTVALTPLRLRWGPDLAESIVRVVGAGDRVARSQRLPRTSDADTRGALYSLFLALGCSGALAAIAALVARADEYALPGVWRYGPTALAALVAGFGALPFALAAGIAGRRASRQRAHQAALGPRALLHHADRGSRAWSYVGLALGVLAAIAVPCAMLLTLAPAHMRVATLAGFAVGVAVAAARPAALSRLVETAQRLTAPRRASGADARLHDFRGVSPFGFEVAALLVRHETRAAWAKLRDLALPETTGARVVAVLRAGSHDGAAIGPETILHPGDEVVLGGSPANVVSARRYLLEPASSEAVVGSKPTSQLSQ